ncbi:MAG: ATP-dependent Clp protease adaptor ClpS [Prevotella sp.]|jgi:ATP-dependent Clp protease adaptor protein ClpS|nr:ATP-dependent Clp protease adaptor ClpS [Prevotella sp.]
MAKTQINNRRNIGVDLQEPRKYNVVFHNDDVTPMGFVVDILRRIFQKDPQEAERLMLKVHNEGRAVVGTYSLDIAASKASKAIHIAKDNNYPLNITVEPS